MSNFHNLIQVDVYCLLLLKFLAFYILVDFDISLAASPLISLAGLFDFLLFPLLGVVALNFLFLRSLTV